MWVKHGKTRINHPPVITIFIGGMFSRDGSSPSRGAAETAEPWPEPCFVSHCGGHCFVSKGNQRPLDLGYLDTFKSGWVACLWIQWGYWHVGSDHNSRCNGVTLLTSSFALWVLCITTFVASGRSNDPAFCDEKSGRCNLASLPFLYSFRNFGHGGARASVIAWPVRIQS